MHRAKLRARYRRIMAFFARATASFIFWEIALPRLGLRFLSRRTRSQRFRKIAARFRALAIQMGGVMIKVGQFMSARLDVLPPEITDELSGLQDEVPPENFDDIRNLAEAELNGPLESKFDWFEAEPLAAASLGQVHRARLKPDATEAADFREVVLKVQRPHIDQLIEVDLRALRRFGGWLEHYEPIRKRVDVRALIEEFSGTIHEEIDYLSEGKNAETFAENFKGSQRVHVPRVVWELTTRRVLTLENVYAIKITDYDAITNAGIDRGDVARELLDTYLQQIFEDGFFHADPHPGNLFVTPLTDRTPDGKEDWQLTFVDFGMVGRVPDNVREGLRELLIGVGTQDPSRVVRAYQVLGVLLPSANLQLLEQAESQLFARFWGKSMKELQQVSHAEMQQFALQFRELMYEMPFQVPHNLLMLGRTVAILSGMCTGLDVNFNLWDQLAPYARKLIAEEATSNWEVWLDEIGKFVQALVALPGQANRVMAQIERGDLQVQVPQVVREIKFLERALNRLTMAVIFVGLLVGGVILYTSGSQLFGEFLMGASLLILLWSFLLPRRRF